MNPSSRLSIQGTCKECTNFRWEICELPGCNGSLVNTQFKKYIVTPPTYANLVINPGSWKGDTKYNIKVFGRRDNGPEGYAVFEVEVNSPPSGGSLDVYPKTGFSLKQMFTLRAPGWRDADGPLFYQFDCRVDSDSRYIPLVSGSEASYVNRSLPNGDKKNNYTLIIRVTVVDGMKAASQANIIVQVGYNLFTVTSES